MGRLQDEMDKLEHSKKGGHITATFERGNTGLDVIVKAEVVATGLEIKSLIYSLVDALAEKEKETVMGMYAQLSIGHLIVRKGEGK